MYIKFLKHGKGNPSLAASYLIDEVDHLNYPRAHVEVLRGDPHVFAALANSIENTWKYTSGVIAWSPTDQPTDQDIQDVLNAFEKHAFAGLEPHQYHFTAVLHQEDDGTKHIHFLVPRIELETGKALNIAPPGHDKYFDPLRDYFNHLKGWSRPDDIRLKKDLQLPDHIQLQDKAVLRTQLIDQPAPAIHQLLNEYINTRILYGLVRDRADIVNALSEIGTITGTGKDSISILLEGRQKAIRLKGALYESTFTVESYTEDRAREANDARASAEDRALPKEYLSDPTRYSTATRTLPNPSAAQVEQHQRAIAELSEKRRTYNRTRYGSVRTTPSELQVDHARQPKFIDLYDQTGGTKQELRGTGQRDGEQYRTDSNSAATDVTRRNTDLETGTESSFQQSAELAHRVSRIGRRDTCGVDYDFSYVGKINERTQNLDESTRRLIEDSNRATEQVFGVIQDVHDAINRAEQNTGTRNSAERRTDLSTEIGNTQHRIQTTLQRLLGKVRGDYESAFTGQIEKLFRTVEYPSFSESANQNQIGTHTTATLFRPTEDLSGAFEDLYLAHARRQSRRRIRNRRKAETAREVDYFIDGSNAQLEIIEDQFRRRFLFRIRESKELAQYFNSIGYLHRSAREVYEFSENLDNAYKQRDIYEVARWISLKYQALDSYDRYKRDPFTERELRLIERMVANDQRILADLKRYTYFNDVNSDDRMTDIFEDQKRKNANRFKILKEPPKPQIPTYEEHYQNKIIGHDHDDYSP